MSEEKERLCWIRISFSVLIKMLMLMLEEKPLKRRFKFVGMKLLDDEEQKLKDSTYFYFILNGRTSFYRKFEGKTINS